MSIGDPVERGILEFAGLKKHRRPHEEGNFEICGVEKRMCVLVNKK